MKSKQVLVTMTGPDRAGIIAEVKGRVVASGDIEDHRLLPISQREMAEVES